MFKLLPKTNIDFMGKRRLAFLFSGLGVAIGLFALLMVLLERANFGIDFSGGIEVQGVFVQPVSTGELRSALSDAGFKGVRIQTVSLGDTTAYLIKLKSGLVGGMPGVADTTLLKGSSQSEQTAAQLVATIDAKFPNNRFTKLSSSMTDPSVGKQLRSQAVWLVVASILGILIYIWIRFDFRFGVTAAIATFHDILFVLGVVFLLHRELTILVVTALLPLGGYSLTDTVVVYDRIRENLKTFRRKADFISTINLSINEVLSRTIMTGLTTMVVVLVLFIFGGEVIHDFALTLMLGLLVGTYSSWFVASALVVEWELRAPKRFK